MTTADCPPGANAPGCHMLGRWPRWKGRVWNDDKSHPNLLSERHRAARPPQPELCPARFNFRIARSYPPKIASTLCAKYELGLLKLA
jgi:hypothetical protein